MSACLYRFPRGMHAITIKMKLKFILCLALVLSGGLFGCSTMPSGTLSKSAEGKLFSNHEAVCLKNDDSARPWQLKYALTEYTVNERELFVTVHDRGELDIENKWRPEYSAAIYVKAGDNLKLLKRLTTEQVYFLEPRIIRANMTNGDWEQLIVITGVYYGTGGFTEEHIFAPVALPVSDLKFMPDLKLEEVEFVPATESFKKYMGADEIIRKNEIDTFTDNGLSFSFEITKNGLATQPIAKVTGTYRLECKSDGGFRIIMDRFKREPITDSGS